MAIFQTGAYSVEPQAVGGVKQAIAEFVRYVEASEPGTLMYLAWQRKSDPSQFLHLFMFEDRAAQAAHGQSEAVRRFEAVYAPRLLGKEVVFTDYEQIAGKVPRAEPGAGQPPRLGGNARRSYSRRKPQPRGAAS